MMFMRHGRHNSSLQQVLHRLQRIGLASENHAYAACRHLAHEAVAGCAGEQGVSTVHGVWATGKFVE